MQDIDFLPDDYVCERTARTRIWWMRAAWGLAITLVAASGLTQTHSLNQLATHRSQLQEETRHLMTRLGSPEQLQREWDEIENEERLLNVLRANVRPSRWISAVVQALPDRVALREMRAQLQESRAESPASQVGVGVSPVTDGQAMAAAARELNRIARMCEPQSLVISLNGTAPDDQTVSHFLVALRGSHLFRHIQLLFTEHAGQGPKAMRTFGIRLTVRSVTNRAEVQQLESADRPHLSGQERPVAGRSDIRSTGPQ